MPEIESMYAWVAEESPGNEGIVGAVLPGRGMVALIGGDRKTIESFRPFAEAIGRAAKKNVRLVRFATRFEIDLIKYLGDPREN